MYQLKTRNFQGTEITYAETPNGHYIGEEEWAKHLQELGIIPELRTPESKVCSIGFCEKEQRWHGWSHRAMCDFGIGSKVKKGDCAYRAPDADSFLEECKNFWGDSEHKALVVARHTQREGVPGVLVEWTYNESVPNQALRGSITGHFTPYPNEWGKGGWTAETLDDAKQMAKDFAESVN